MPELPEVETTRRGLEPLVAGRSIATIAVRQPNLRWPVAAEVSGLDGQTIRRLERRAKWLIWRLDSGSLLWHLGMSGSFRAWNTPPPPGRHDHIDVVTEHGPLVRYTDPRRFGALLWQPGPDPLAHPRLRALGPEPLGADFDGELLWRRSRGRKAAIKSFIMDAHTVVGVGNIYAAEALFSAGIHPKRAAGRVSRQRYRLLALAIRETLSQAIDVGGTSLKDFTGGDGSPGYFGQKLKVYGRKDQLCPACARALKAEVIGQRATVWCPGCQH